MIKRAAPPECRPAVASGGRLAQKRPHAFASEVRGQLS